MSEIKAKSVKTMAIIWSGRAIDLSNLSGSFGEITAYRWW
jgi:hypothetical protein